MKTLQPIQSTNFNNSALQPLPFNIVPNISGNINYTAPGSSNQSAGATGSGTSGSGSGATTGSSATGAGNGISGAQMQNENSGNAQQTANSAAAEIKNLSSAIKKPANYPWIIIGLMAALLILAYILKKIEKK